MAERSKSEDQLNDYKKSKGVSGEDRILFPMFPLTVYYSRFLARFSVNNCSDCAFFKIRCRRIYANHPVCKLTSLWVN